MEIDERALEKNIRALRSLLAKETKLCVTVKANAYGHGIDIAAKTAVNCNVDLISVDNLDEALSVRSISKTIPVLIIGYTPQDRYGEIISNNLMTAVFDTAQIKKFNESAEKAGKKASIHLKIETGTSRLGILPSHVQEFIEELEHADFVELSGVYTHFARAEESDRADFTFEQTAVFEKAVSELVLAGHNPKYIHAACSAALILYPQTHFNTVRTGISFYGFWPSRHVRAAAKKSGRWVELESALSWKTRVAQVKPLQKGTPIGYGGTDVLGKDSMVAVLPVGYYDGFDRRLSRIGTVLIKGHVCKVLGNVCMNMIMVDVSDLPLVKEGETAVLIGHDGSQRVRAEDIADSIGTIHYEIVSRINPIIPRVLV